jgi:hypothetical protein
MRQKTRTKSSWTFCRGTRYSYGELAEQLAGPDDKPESLLLELHSSKFFCRVASAHVCLIVPENFRQYLRGDDLVLPIEDSLPLPVLEHEENSKDLHVFFDYGLAKPPLLYEGRFRCRRIIPEDSSNHALAVLDREPSERETATVGPTPKVAGRSVGQVPGVPTSVSGIELPGRDPDAEGDASEPARRSGTQGFAEAADRAVLESYGMTSATKFFREKGYVVTDVHGDHPYDLECHRGNELLFVEVKATQGRGDEVLLSRGEVAFARGHRGEMALFVIHSVELRPGVEGVKAAEGTVRVLIHAHSSRGIGERAPSGCGR